ncbi:UNVERIFIED_CONTAM: hypothetical protein FKN15_056823 [Acipenser sinensis]
MSNYVPSSHQFPTQLNRTEGSVGVNRSHNRASFLFYTEEQISASYQPLEGKSQPCRCLPELTGRLTVHYKLNRTEGSVGVNRSHNRATFLFYTEKQISASYQPLEGKSQPCRCLPELTGRLTVHYRVMTKNSPYSLPVLPA